MSFPVKSGFRPRRIPYGIANYEEIVRDNYFFVDKTDYIRQLENYKNPVFLRPRRFGKTLFCSILECYYDINRRDKFARLFGNTAIGKNPTGEQNSYLLMRLNFSTIPVGKNMEEMEKNFDFDTKLAIKSFLHYYSDYFQTLKMEEEPSSAQLQSIVSHILENRVPPLYLIIDEYDNFSNQLVLSQDTGLYEELTSLDSFFKTFFKVIKAGTESGAIGRIFITGVLPITIDDLTSGFNIAEIITLKKNFHNLLGFTKNEVIDYLQTIYQEYQFSQSNFETVLTLLKNYYNGYRFFPGTEALYNSTIISFFLRNLLEEDGEIPREFIDTNLRPDLSWLKRLTRHEADTRDLLDKLIFHNRLEYDLNMLSSKFNAHQFFNKAYYPVSLFYLGMVTVADDFWMMIPNQTMKEIFLNYYNEMNRIYLADGYVPHFERFLQDVDLEKLFSAYWKHYVGQIPAQAADKANENFYRTTFYELCRRYLSRNFIFTIEMNYPGGRSDWEMTGKDKTVYENIHYLVEFKHFSAAEAHRLKLDELQAPYESELIQLERYASDILKTFPQHQITKFVIYTIAAKGYRFFKLG
jgi:hypothetical protein